jgi:peptidoglycan/LPS O-acetylase OafA/YrhL
MSSPATPPGSNSAFAAFRSHSRFGSLDGLRALSVVAVIWHHTGGGMVAAEWAQQGHHGVTLFFAISGFLITTLLLREHDRHGAIDLRAFYVRRALRIFPLYYAVLLIYVVLVFLLERHTRNGQDFFSNLVYFATYTSNWFVALDGRTIFYFAWSLAAEEQFYLVWPPLMKRLGTRARALLLAAGVVMALIALELLLPHLLADSPTAQVLLRVVLNVPLAIVAGVAAALALHDPRSFARLWPWLGGSRWHSLLWLVLAVALTVIPGSPRFAGHVALALLVVSCCMREDHMLAWLLRQPFVVYLGSISYGLYLLHMLCKNVVVKLAAVTGFPLGPGLLFLLTLMLAVVVAGLSFKYFESRFLQLKGRFERNAAPLAATGRA